MTNIVFIFKLCNFQTIWKDSFNQHMQWQRALPLKTAKRKVDMSVGPTVSKKSKEQTKNNFKCDTCGHTTGYKYKRKRHMERYKHNQLKRNFYEFLLKTI